jgi:hypothetical protein
MTDRLSVRPVQISDAEKSVVRQVEVLVRYTK